MRFWTFPPSNQAIYSITVCQGIHGSDVKLVRLDSRFLAVSPTAYSFLATPKENTLGKPHSLGVLELEKRKNPKMHRRKFFKLSDYDDKLSWCEMIKDLVDNKYPDAEKITLVMNKDDVVLISMLEVCFSAEDALRIYQKLDIHPITNRHGWLNISNIEAIEVLRKCLCKGIQNIQDIAEELLLWKNECNEITLNLDLLTFRSAFASCR